MIQSGSYISTCSLVWLVPLLNHISVNLKYYRQIPYQLSHENGPRILEWVDHPFSRGSFWSRNWTGVIFLPGKSHGQRSLVGYSPWGCKESDTTERVHSLSLSSALQVGSLPTEPSGKPRTWRTVIRECEVKHRVLVGYSAWVESGGDDWGPSRVWMSGGTRVSGFFSWYIKHVCSVDPCLLVRALSCATFSCNLFCFF